MSTRITGLGKTAEPWSLRRIPEGSGLSFCECAPSRERREHGRRTPREEKEGPAIQNLGRVTDASWDKNGEKEARARAKVEG